MSPIKITLYLSSEKDRFLFLKIYKICTLEISDLLYILGIMFSVVFFA